MKRDIKNVKRKQLIQRHLQQHQVSVPNKGNRITRICSSKEYIYEMCSVELPLLCKNYKETYFFTTLFLWLLYFILLGELQFYIWIQKVYSVNNIIMLKKVKNGIFFIIIFTVFWIQMQITGTHKIVVEVMYINKTEKRKLAITL